MSLKYNDAIAKRAMAMNERVRNYQENDLYYLNLPITEFLGGSKVLVGGREMGMYASYSYLGLIGHERINEAAIKAVEKYGTGTHGVRLLAGTLDLHEELEETIANFKHTEAAISYSSGYVTNLTVVSALVRKGDWVISDKLNHASIVDGCHMSGAKFTRFNHNDMDHLEVRLQQAGDAAKLVIADSVFSMDGDVIDLPKVSELCKKYNAWLMIDEAHSVGVLGETGTGIEEHFGMPYDTIDIKMGTMSKTIPSVGGYVAANKELINYFRHASRAYIFSAAVPPAQAAASNEAFKVILDEPWRIEKLRKNADQFINGIKALGFDTLQTETAVVPVICGADEVAYAMTREAHKRGFFVLPVVSPAVGEGLARLRATVTSAHESDDIAKAMAVIGDAGKKLGVI